MTEIQFLEIKENTTESEITNFIGIDNINYIDNHEYGDEKTRVSLKNRNNETIAYKVSDWLSKDSKGNIKVLTKEWYDYVMDQVNKL